jgi:hypothetical protein
MEIEDRRRANSYLVFLGWLAVAIAVLALVVALASDRTPPNCQSTGFGSCWSDRDRLQLLGIILGAPCLGIHFVAGLVVTALYNRAGWRSFWTGTAGFVTTVPLTAVGLVIVVVLFYN